MSRLNFPRNGINMQMSYALYASQRSRDLRREREPDGVPFAHAGYRYAIRRVDAGLIATALPGQPSAAEAVDNLVGAVRAYAASTGQAIRG